jgi:hypothetical protein
MPWNDYEDKRKTTQKGFINAAHIRGSIEGIAE